MNPPTPNPSSPDSPAAPAEPPVSQIAVVRQVYVSHFELKTPAGESYLEGGARKVVKAESEPLAQFLADAQLARGEGQQKREVTVSYFFGTVPANQWRPLRFVTQGILDAFEKAAQDFYARAHADQKLAQFQKQARLHFRLPDPELDPESYWLVGDRFNPKLVILWGCEKLDANKRPLPSLPLVNDPELFPDNPVTVVDKLRARLMNWEAILEENLALIAEKKEPLSRFLSRPVFDKQHLRVIGLQPLLAPDNSYPISKFRPLGKVASTEVVAFEKAAEAYYLKAHQDPDSIEAHPEISAYERELRRGFRLPDVDTAPTSAGPGIEGIEGLSALESETSKRTGKAPKGAKDMAAAARVTYWVYGKRLAPRLMISVEGNEPFEQCLCLLPDEDLDLPPGAALGGALPADALGMETPKTVVGKLRLRQVNRVKQLAIAGSILGTVLVLGLVTFFSWPKGLVGLSATVNNDPALDPGNRRNVLEVAFNNHLNPGPSGAGAKSGAAAFGIGQYTLRALVGGKEFKLRPPQLKPGDPRRVVLTLDGVGESLDDSAGYTLKVEKAKDTWGNRVTTTNLPVVFVDKRPPSLTGRIEPAPEDFVGDALLVEFDEPLDKVTAEIDGNYLISGPSSVVLKQLRLQKDLKTVLLKADKPFDSGSAYTLTVRNISDASRNRNRMPDTTTNFMYVSLPLRLRAVSAADFQHRIKVEFSRAIDRDSARTAFKLDKPLLIGSVVPLDDKSVELVLSNSCLAPNVKYALQIDKLKDTSGKPGTELTTNAVVSFTGTPDLVPPGLMDVSFASNCLQLTFSKDLMPESATKEANYALSVRPKGQWEKLPTRFNPVLTGGNVVRLNLAEALPTAAVRFEFQGVKDLAGNSTNGFREFSTGISVRIQPIKMPSFMGPERNALVLLLQGRIDKSCEKPENFVIADAEGNPLRGIEVSDIKMTPDVHSTRIILFLDRKLEKDTFNVLFYKLKLEGEARLQEGEARVRP